MIVPACTTLAIRCPQCGRLELTVLSRFALGKGKSMKVHCSCGHHQLTVGIRQKRVWFQVPCYLCDGLHFLYYHPELFWGPELKQISCAETELQLGVFGSEEAVANYAKPGSSELERLLEDDAFDDYFDEPGVMYQLLSQVQSLSEAGNLTCHCGNREIAIDIFPDRLELSCGECGSYETLSAVVDEDLEPLLLADRLEIGAERTDVDRTPCHTGQKK